MIEPVFPELRHAHAFGTASFLPGVDVTFLLHDGGGSARVEASADLFPGCSRDVIVPAIAHLIAEAGHIANWDPRLRLLPSRDEARHTVRQQERPDLLDAVAGFCRIVAATDR